MSDLLDDCPEVMRVHRFDERDKAFPVRDGVHSDFRTSNGWSHLNL
jgi:hypothetical protein